MKCVWGVGTPGLKTRTMISRFGNGAFNNVNLSFIKPLVLSQLVNSQRLHDYDHGNFTDERVIIKSDRLD